jgi:hypothetical protein
MSIEIWAAIIGSLVLLIFTGIGVLFWAHMTEAKEDATKAHEKAHELEVQVSQQQAKHSEELRVLERQMLTNQLEMARDYVRKPDYDSTVTEMFRKLEKQDRQVADGFAGLRSWIDGKFDTFATQLNGKQDRRGVAS